MHLQKKIKINNASGLHARPAALFVQIANKYDSEVIIKKGIQEVNGKSIMGIMMLAAECGSQIILQVEGDDAQEAIEELEDFLNKET
ncbi:MAG: HPr family phosphocarrier protein [Candidatus Kappaea frigidicola]|nr:HPr family phosphocarrier protein [Candidatus Kappaea frigidicola]